MAALVQELEKLAELAAKGVLSPEEFDLAKQKVLRGSGVDEAIQQMRNAPAERGPRDKSASSGDQIGAYILLEKLGDGGMASVYRGRHTSRTIAARQGGEVAIKVLHPHLANKRSCKRRFKREAEIGSRLNHPNIVRVHDLVADSECWALVLDLVHGPSFGEVLHQHPDGMPLDMTMRYFHQLLDGVEAAHQAGVVHRDLKPDNVLVRAKDNTLHLVDFGIASSDQMTRNTRVGARMGTYGYGAPEQFTDARTADMRSDIYALGVVLFEMATGHIPWPTEGDVRELLACQLAGPPAMQGCDRKIASAVRHMLQPEPDHRPATIAQVRTILSKDQAEVRAKYYDRPRWDASSSDDDTRTWAKQLAKGELPEVKNEPVELAPLQIIEAKRAPVELAPRPGWHKAAAVLGVLATGAAIGVSWGRANAERHLFPASEDSAELVIATGISTPPLFWKTNERVVGLDADLARALAGQLGKRSVRFIQDPNPLDIVGRGEADLAVAGLYVDQDKALYSIPYAELALVAVTRKDLANKVRRGGPMLEGLTCSSSDPHAAHLLQQTFCQWLPPRGIPDVDAVALGHVEITALPSAYAPHQPDVRFTDVEVGSVELGVAATPGNTRLRAMVDAALDELDTIGVLNRLRAKYSL